MRFSLREFLLVSAAISLAIPALYYANEITGPVVGLITAALIVAAVLRALIARELRQAAAIGFVVPALLYVSLLFSSQTYRENGRPNDYELNPYRGRLITTKLMKSPLQWINARRSYYIDPNGKHTESPPPPGTSLGGGFGGGAWQYRQLPLEEPFMLTAHCLWTLLFGYLGMKYAERVYAQREKSKQQPAPNA